MTCRCEGTNRPRRRAAMLLGALLLFAGACGVSSPYETISDYDVVITGHQKGFDFGAQETFFVADSILRIIDPDKPPSDINTQYDDFIIEQIKANMTRLGYVEELEPETNRPDLFIAVAITRTDWYGYSYPWYPGWPWYPWYPPGWYYPPVAYAYSSGSIIMTMVDVERADEETKIAPVVWAAVVNGVIESGKSGMETRISRNIRQAFNQSPYLGVK